MESIHIEVQQENNNNCYLQEYQDYNFFNQAFINNSEGIVYSSDPSSPNSSPKEEAVHFDFIQPEELNLPFFSSEEPVLLGSNIHNQEAVPVQFFMEEHSSSPLQASPISNSSETEVNSTTKKKSTRGRKRKVIPPSESDVSAVCLAREDLLKLTSEELEERTKVIVTNKGSLSLAEEREIKRQRRIVKNRESAQQSRQRKKEQMEVLETEIFKLKQENTVLNDQVNSLMAENNTLKSQLMSLNNLIAKTSSMVPNFIQGAQNLTRDQRVKKAGACLMVVLFSFGLLLGGNVSDNRLSFKPTQFGSSHYQPAQARLPLNFDQSLVPHPSTVRNDQKWRVWGIPEEVSKAQGSSSGGHSYENDRNDRLQYGQGQGLSSSLINVETRASSAQSTFAFEGGAQSQQQQQQQQQRQFGVNGAASNDRYESASSNNNNLVNGGANALVNAENAFGGNRNAEQFGSGRASTTTTTTTTTTTNTIERVASENAFGKNGPGKGRDKDKDKDKAAPADPAAPPAPRGTINNNNRCEIPIVENAENGKEYDNKLEGVQWPPQISPSLSEILAAEFMNQPSSGNLSKLLNSEVNIVPHGEFSQDVEIQRREKNTAYFKIKSLEQVFPEGAGPLDPEAPLYLSLILTDAALPGRSFQSRDQKVNDTPVVEIYAQVLDVGIPISV